MDGWYEIDGWMDGWNEMERDGWMGGTRWNVMDGWVERDGT